MTTLTFLGTGGGRFATIYQPRSTGGIYLEDGVRLHIDPGPGALVNMSRLSMDPGKTDGILVSHCHPDHYTDAEVLVEGMAGGGFRKRGVIVGSRSVIEGVGNLGPAISAYHRSLAERSVVIERGSSLRIEGTEISATATFHSDPTGVGFRIKTGNGDASYVGDSELREDLVTDHEGSRVLILCLTRPLASCIPYHMCTEDAAALVGRLEPEAAILTHFGMRLLHEGADRQAQFIEKATGVRTISARDLMWVQMGRGIRVGKQRTTPPNLRSRRGGSGRG